MDLLLNEDVKQISMGALQQFNLDVIQCERMFIFVMKLTNLIGVSFLVALYRVCCVGTGAWF